MKRATDSDYMARLGVISWVLLGFQSASWMKLLGPLEAIIQQCSMIISQAQITLNPSNKAQYSRFEAIVGPGALRYVCMQRANASEYKLRGAR